MDKYRAKPLDRYSPPFHKPPTINPGVLASEIKKFSLLFINQTCVEDEGCLVHIPIVFQKQTRSNDEIATTFSYCKRCNMVL